jgi:hypothetical protein
VRRVAEAADVDLLHTTASTSGRRATLLDVLSAHLWKLIAVVGGGFDARGGVLLHRRN